MKKISTLLSLAVFISHQMLFANVIFKSSEPFAEANLSIKPVWISGLQSETKSFNVYPDPITTTATIVFNTSTDGILNLSVYDLLGKEIEAFPLGHTYSGSQEVKWNTVNRTNGIYIIRLTNNQELIGMRKVIINR